MILILLFASVESAFRGHQSKIELEQILQNERLRTMFWLFLFKKRVHRQLSFWIETETQLKPQLRKEEAIAPMSRSCSRKYLEHGNCFIRLVQALLNPIQTLLGKEEGLTLNERDKLVDLLEKGQAVVKEILRETQFVLFLESGPFKEMLTVRPLDEMLSLAKLSGHEPMREIHHVEPMHDGMQPVSTVLTYDSKDIKVLYQDDSEQPPDCLAAFFDPQDTGSVWALEKPKAQLYQTSFACNDHPFYAAISIRYVAMETVGEYVPTGIALISRYPVLETLKQRLERVKGTPEQQLKGLLEPWYPADGRIELNFQVLLRQLCARDLVKLVGAVLLEKRIAIVASDLSASSLAAEGLKILIQPLLWSHIFAPFLPKCLMGALDCPMPFIFGVQPSFMEENTDAEELVVVNLDTGIIDGVEDIELPYGLEDKTVKKLIKKENISQAEVIQVFHGLIKTILRNARDYRFRLSDGLTETFVFDCQGFIQDGWLRNLGFSERTRHFYLTFVQTQMFSQYIATDF